MHCRTSPKIFQENLELELRCHNARDEHNGEVEPLSGAVSAFSRVLSAASGALSCLSLPSASDSLSPKRVASKSFHEKLGVDDSDTESKTFPAVRLVVDDLSLPLATKTQVRPVQEFLRHLMETGDASVRFGSVRAFVTS